jgi:hypothetical protein
VEDVLKLAEKQSEIQVELRRKGIGLREVARRIAEEEGMQEADLYKRGRTDTLSRAKAKLIHIGVEYLGRSNREMASLTRMSDPSASNARVRAAKFLEGTDLRKWLCTN